MSKSIGYFTEIEMLKEKINELEQKLQEEREEHRDIFFRMKADNELLKEQNDNLRMENLRVKTAYELLKTENDNLLVENAEMDDKLERLKEMFN